MIQVGPNYTRILSPEVAEQQFQIRFNGPGLYTYDRHFMVVVPRPPQGAGDVSTVWHQKQPKDTVYEFHVYNVPLSQSIFGVKVPPTRNE